MGAKIVAGVSVLTIETLVVTPFQQNARVIAAGEQCVVLDPGGEVGRILKVVGSRKVVAIVLTHYHIDHCAGVAGLLERLGPVILYGGEERELRERIAYQAAFFGLSADDYHNCPPADVLLSPGSRITLLGLEWEARFTPGHSPGHYSYVLPKAEYLLDGQAFRDPVCFAGDALFRGSIGRTDLPGGNHSLLLESISSQLLTLPDETVVLPGHGEETTIGAERISNPFLQGL